MSIPNFQTLMLPLLELAGDRIEHSFKEAIPFLATKFALTEDEKRELLPSGKQPKFNNRVYRTKTHLLKAGLLNSDRRGAFKITQEGLNVLATRPTSIDTMFLERYDKYCEFRTPNKKPEQYVASKVNRKKTLEKILDAVHQQIQENLSKEILKKIEQCSPYFFESLVIDLLISMGYGGSHKEVERGLKRSPEGIDGIIKADRLGLDVIYLRAKQGKDRVSELEIREFAGALGDRNIRKGIFIATSDFSQKAIDYVTRIDSKIVLVDGSRLAELTIEYNVGIIPVSKYEVKKVDLNYFIEDRFRSE